MAYNPNSGKRSAAKLTQRKRGQSRTIASDCIVYKPDGSVEVWPTKSRAGSTQGARTRHKAVIARKERELDRQHAKNVRDEIWLRKNRRYNIDSSNGTRI